MTSTLFAFYSTSIGKKVVMAATGVVLLTFVAVHMAGNMQIYLGPQALNDYAAFLHKNLAVLWAFRILLILCVALHIVAAVQLTLQSWRARPRRYVTHRFLETDYAARTMRWSGPILGGFIVYHLLHFTTGTAHPTFQDGNVYANVVAGFQQWPAAIAYIIAMVLLGLHLFHGLWSLLQTLGANHPRYNALRRMAAAAFAFVVVTGNISMPVAVLTGLVR